MHCVLIELSSVVKVKSDAYSTWFKAAVKQSELMTFPVRTSRHFFHI